MLPLWTLPFVCEISDKLQVVNKELTRDWVNSKVADIEFYSQKKLTTISSIKFHVNFFSVVLDNATRIRDKMQVVYKEMACDGAKSNVAR